MDSDGEAALTTLTAFLGAVFGCTGCLAGALSADLFFAAVAGFGAVICGYIWVSHLEM